MNAAVKVARQPPGEVVDRPRDRGPATLRAGRAPAPWQPVGEVTGAAGPPEARGRARDEVRLLVARGGRVAHRAFRDLPAILRPGDLLVANASATLPAALPIGDGLLHLSTDLPGGLWVVELRERRGHGSGPDRSGRAGQVLGLPAGASATLLWPYPAAAGPAPRLWVAALDHPGRLPDYLAAHGRPIRYAYAAGAWPLEAYQTVFAAAPGSAEMASAGRPFSPRVLADLAGRRIGVATVVLHSGVSSQEAGEPPYAERYAVPEATAAAVNRTHAAGGRVVAVGTTVVRALTSSASSDGRVHPVSGWTELVVTPATPVPVDGILTGFHPPGASHLGLLRAVAGDEPVLASYAAAVAGGYLGHEFGDGNLLLPLADRD